MKCPFCGQEMQEGSLIANNYKVKFVPDHKGLLLGIWAQGFVPLGKKPPLGRATVPNTWHCNACDKYVMNI